MSAQATDPRLINKANILARALYRDDLDKLSAELQADVWKIVYIEEAERQERLNPTPGYCYQCGAIAGAGSYECRPCHENNRGQMERERRESNPRPLPTARRYYGKRRVTRLRREQC